MTLYCGIDLHSNNSVVAVLDEQDRTVYEKRLPNDIATITEALCIYQSELAACVVESTYNWYWLVDGLMDAGFPVRLAHTSALPEYSGLKYSNDFSDARHLAHLLRLGLLPTGYIYPKEERALRDLLRRRLLLVTTEIATPREFAELDCQAQWSATQYPSDQAADEGAARRLSARTRLAGWRDHPPGTLLVGKRCSEDRAGTAASYQAARGLSVVAECVGSRSRAGYDHCIRNGHHRTLCQLGKLCFVCPMCEIREGQQQEAQRPRQQERQQILSLGFHGGRPLRCDLGPQNQTVLSTQESQSAHPGGQKGVANKLARACYHMLKRGEEFDVTRAFS